MTKVEQSFEQYDMSELVKLLSEYQQDLRVVGFHVVVQDKYGVTSELKFNEFCLKNNNIAYPISATNSIRLG